MVPEVARAGQADVYSMFRTRARVQQGALALEDGEKRLSYGTLLNRVDRLAAVLLARGVKTGDRVVSTFNCNWRPRGSERSSPA
jgi:non-ribosomal peptide synthetase component E (peptide arylation enzyme)